MAFGTLTAFQRSVFAVVLFVLLLVLILLCLIFILAVLELVFLVLVLIIHVHSSRFLPIKIGASPRLFAAACRG